MHLRVLVGLPPELYSIWEAYPWRFGEPYCLFKTYLTELMSTASVLTILAFTVERYVAICHPLRAQAVSTPRRAVKTLVALWIGAFLAALPYPLHTRTYYYLDDPRHSDGGPLTDSLVCNIPLSWMAQMKYVIQASTLLLFVAPMCVMTALYVLIAVALRRRSSARASRIISGSSGEDSGRLSPLRRHDGGETTDQRRRLSPVIQRSPNSRRTVVRILGEFDYSLLRLTDYALSVVARPCRLRCLASIYCVMVCFLAYQKSLFRILYSIRNLFFCKVPYKCLFNVVGLLAPLTQLPAMRSTKATFNSTFYCPTECRL